MDLELEGNLNFSEDHLPNYSSTSTKENTTTSKWLIAHDDPLANIYTHSSCICFTDLYGDGDHKLIIADLSNGIQSMKLNVYKGTLILAQLTLIDCPSGVVSFYMNSGEPRIPAIGVSSGSFLYIYKNLKPFYKFSLPNLDVDQIEYDAWTQVKEDKIDTAALREILNSLRSDIGETALTARSQAFLDITDSSEMEKFVNDNKTLEIKRTTVITCITTIKKTVAEDNNLNCLVIGTENKDIFIIEPDAFTILALIQLTSVPVFIEVSGLYDVEYRLIVSCRDAHIYTVKRGFKTGRLCVQLNSQPVGLLRSHNNIIVACLDCSISCYTSNGNCIWKIQQPANITAIAAVDIEILGLGLIAVAMDNKEVHFYNNKIKVDSFKTESVITSMKFGRYGREDNTLVMISRTGHLSIRIIKRTAKFISLEPDPNTAHVTHVSRLNLPKKTKLFVDQSMREREEALNVHRTFQQDLYRLRLTAARAYVKAIASNLNPVSSNSMNPLKLSAQVHGLGPVFRLILEIQNTSLEPATNLFLVLYYDMKMYKIDRKLIPIPFLYPGYLYNFYTRVECVNEFNMCDFIKIYVIRENESIPLITAMINMPASEAPI